MTRLHIHGIGTLSIGQETPFAKTWAMLETLPIKEYVKPKVSRRFGRLSKMIYIAASRAIQDAGIEDGSTLPTVNATCMGETNASLGLLEQIQRTKGKLISPAFVPNSVHNAPAGYLSIGLKNRSPSITVSQGWVSSDSERVLLTGEVRIRREASAGEGSVAVDTRDLTVLPKEDFAETDQPTVIVTDEQSMARVGMRAYLKDGRLQMLEKVRSRYEPKKP